MPIVNEVSVSGDIHSSRVSGSISNSLNFSGEGSLPAILDRTAIHYDTTSNWNAKSDLIGELGNLYIYSDYRQITDEDGTVTYIPAIKIGDDKTALANLPFAISGVYFVGYTTTALTDGAITNPIKINSEDYTAKAGDLVFYGDSEFLFDGTKWTFFGDFGALGNLAFKDSASTTYTPTGSVSTPTISIKTAGSTTTIKNPTSKTVATSVVAAAPGATAPSNSIVYYSVSDEELSLYQLGYNTDASISTTNVTVKNGDAEYQSSVPKFTGSNVTITVS